MLGMNLAVIDKKAVLIGYLTRVRNDAMTARLTEWDKEPTRTAKESDERELIGQLGTFVSITRGATKILAIVMESSVEHEPGGERSVELVPLGELNEHGKFQRGVKRYPSVGAEVYPAGADEIKTVFMDDRKFCLPIGYLSSYKTMSISLDPSCLFGRHFAILGQSGSGKSWSVTTLLQRSVSSMPNAHIILLDLHGEYCWRDEDSDEVHSAFDSETMRYMDARKLEIPYWLLGYSELVDLLIDRGDENSSIQMAFLRETLYQLKRVAAKEMGLDSFSIDSPIYFSMSELYKSFKDANEQRGDFGKSAGPLFGQFDEFLIKLQSRFSDVRYDFLLRPKIRTSSESLAGLLRDFVGLGDPKRQITVIDLSAVPFDIRPSVSAQIGRLAFEFNYWNPRNREFPIALVCEEAHSYIPREGGGKYDKARESMERIAKEGRKYGVGLGVISQRPHELSETVLSQCGTFICFRISNPDDQAYVRSLVPEGERRLIDTLAALGRGEALALGESAPLPIRFQFYKPDPPPNSNDVDFLNKWRAGPEDLDVESIADHWRRQGR